MTAPPAPPAGSSGSSPLSDGDTRDAVVAALGAEHAAIWAYGLASAYLAPSDGNAVADAVAVHRARRDAVEAMLEAAGTPPPPAAASYRTERPVTDTASAADMLVSAEDDIGTAWRAVIERTDDAGLRATGVDALLVSSRTRVRWSARVPPNRPAARAFPGTAP